MPAMPGFAPLQYATPYTGQYGLDFSNGFRLDAGQLIVGFAGSIVSVAFLSGALRGMGGRR
jgi:hypothetical protein